MTLIVPHRRSFLRGLGAALFVAPAIVPITSLMPVKVVDWTTWQPRHLKHPWWLMRGYEVIPTDALTWTKAFSSEDRSLGRTRVGLGRTGVGGQEVSTVFLGIDHSFSDTGPPVLFETMVFGVDGCGTDMRRYRTRAEAEAGHLEIVAELQRKQKN